MKKKWLLLTWCSILSLLLMNKAYTAELPIAEEYQVKAVFLFNFSSFITWPATAFADSKAPFAICIIGQDPFQAELDITVEDEKIAGRPVVIQRIGTIDEVDRCQILFISQSYKNQLTRVFTYLKQQSHAVLTVSDIDGFIQQGGVIEFFKRGTKIRFMIDYETAKKIGLWVSGNLLSIAEVVDYSK